VCLCVCLCVCLSAAACPHYCTYPDVTWGNRRGCPLVVHYWADSQSLHRLRCYDSIAPQRIGNRCTWQHSGECEMSASICLYSLCAWLDVVRFCVLYIWTCTAMVRPTSDDMVIWLILANIFGKLCFSQKNRLFRKFFPPFCLPASGLTSRTHESDTQASASLKFWGSRGGYSSLRWGRGEGSTTGEGSGEEAG